MKLFYKNNNTDFTMTPEKAGWTYCGLDIINMEFNETRKINTKDSECAVLPLSGSASITVDNVSYMLKGRSSVFKEITDFMYIPRDTDFFITCVSKQGGQYAIPKSKCDKKLSPRYGSVDNVKIELRGAGQASRQINNFMAPGVWDHADKLCAVEVLTPSGNWSSYPPHKHDEESDGAINEEIYYFKCNGENGYGFHSTYTKDKEIDETVTIRDGDCFLVPKGYHGPCVAPPGYDMYYLNVLAGPNETRKMCFCWDKDHEWVTNTWKDQKMDPRLPMTVKSRIERYTLHMGRSSIDLYSQDIGEEFVNIKGFNSFVGGSPLNTAVGVNRLGVKSAVITGIGDDHIGDYIKNFLDNEKVITDYLFTKPNKRTSAVILGIKPPNNFPLVYYRNDCADFNITIDDVKKVNFDDCHLFQFAGTNLAQEPSRSATIYAIEQAKKHKKKVVFDLDFRPDQWDDIRQYGLTIRSVLSNVDIVIGTDDEINAAIHDEFDIEVIDGQVSDARISGDIFNAIEKLKSYNIEIIVRKIGEDGCEIYTDNSIILPQSFPVEVVNILGAGDGFAAGFIYAYVYGYDLYECGKYANACGAILVTKEGCANFMPTANDVNEFIKKFEN